MYKYSLITAVVLQAWRSASSYSSGLVFDRGLPLNPSASQLFTALRFLPAFSAKPRSGLGAAACLHRKRSTGAPGRKVKDRQAPTFAFCAVALAVFAYYSQINMTDAHVYVQTHGVPR